MTVITNKELIEQILEMPNNELTKTKLRDMKKEELEQHLYLLQDKAEQEQESEPVAKEPEAPAEPVAEKKEEVAAEQPETKKPLEPIVAKKTTKGKLEIAKDLPYFAHGATVRLTNLGGGVLYYGKEIVHYGKEDCELYPGQSVDIEGAEVIVMLAMSQPEYLIEEH